jgi:muramoyltetrapeptide carboxypeptidase LdcA involved in peptidoglycan recycling
LFIREDYETTFNDAVKIALKDLNIPVICDADIGHVSPQMAIVNGAILKITSENSKGIVETNLR